MTLVSAESLREPLSNPDVEKRLAVTPLLEDSQVGPASIDLRLGSEFKALRRAARPGIDPAVLGDLQPTELTGDVRRRFGEPFWLHPGQFVLGATLEYLRLPRGMGGYVQGRSSWGRVGLIVATAVLVQPGYRGCLTLELVNEGETPIALYPGVRIAQIALHWLDSETEHPDALSGGRYFGATTPLAAKLEKERDEIARLQRLGEALTTVPQSP
jgi:dCTP deaminase